MAEGSGRNVPCDTRRPLRWRGTRRSGAADPSCGDGPRRFNVPWQRPAARRSRFGGGRLAGDDRTGALLNLAREDFANDR